MTKKDKITYTFEDWINDWIKTAQNRDHVLQRYSDNQCIDAVDMHAFESENHSGPVCLKCGWGVCIYCNPNPDEIPYCKK